MGAGRTSTTERDVAHPSGDDDQVAGLADLLVASLEILAKAGQADAACRAAGKACAVLRQKPTPPNGRNSTRSCTG